MNPRWTGLGPEARPVINTNAHPWAIMPQNDKKNIYVKGTCDGLDGEGIWKYSMTDNEWSTHPRPNLKGYTKFILTTYRSNLACIGGMKRVPENGYVANSCIFMWNENNRSWNPDVIQIEDAENVPWYDASASSDGNNLFLAWQKENKIHIRFLYPDGQQAVWMNRDGPECKSADSHIEISIISNTIFLTQHSQFTPTVIHKASMEWIRSGIADPTHFGNMLWMEANWCKGDRRMYKHAASYISNLVVLGQKIVLLDPCERSALLFQLQWEGEPDRALAWIETEKQLDFDWQINTYPSMFGLSDGKVLVMGHSNILHGQICVFMR